jgi:hypothetical protein
MTKVRRYSHSVSVSVNLGAVILIALVIWMCVALAGCGTAGTTAAPARPAQCTALLAQLKSFDAQAVASQKNSDAISLIGESSIMQSELGTDETTAPQPLKTDESVLAAALQTMNADNLNTSLYQIKAVCG